MRLAGWRKLKLLKVAVTLMGALLIVSCSDDKSPPDDGKGGGIHKVAKVIACSSGTSALFRQCAEALLVSSELSYSERVALSSCGFESAVPDTSSEDLFEVARATIKAHCVFGY